MENSLYNVDSSSLAFLPKSAGKHGRVSHTRRAQLSPHSICPMCADANYVSAKLLDSLAWQPSFAGQPTNKNPSLPNHRTGGEKIPRSNTKKAIAAKDNPIV